jgi:hypothetical protein
MLDCWKWPSSPKYIYIYSLGIRSPRLLVTRGSPGHTSPVRGGGPNLRRPSWASPSASPIHPQVTPNCHPPSFQTLAVASLGALGRGGSSSTPPRLLLHPRRGGASLQVRFLPSSSRSSPQSPVAQSRCRGALWRGCASEAEIQGCARDAKI